MLEVKQPPLEYLSSMIYRSCVQWYKYVFYKNYRWSLRVNTDRTGHETHAAIILSATMGFNFLAIIFAIFSICYLTTGYKVSTFLLDPKIRIYMNIGIGVCAVLLMKMNFVLLKKIGYQNIIQEFSGESPRQRRFGTVLVACYEVGSILLGVVSATLPS